MPVCDPLRIGGDGVAQLGRQRHQFGGKNRLCPEGDIQSFIVGFGLGHAAEHHDRQVGSALPKTFHKVMAGFAGHNVVGDDEIDFPALIAVDGCKRCVSRVGCTHFHPSTVEDGFARERLYRVVVDYENHRGSFL